MTAERMISEAVEQFGLRGGGAEDFPEPKSEFLPRKGVAH